MTVLGMMNWSPEWYGAGRHRVEDIACNFARIVVRPYRETCNHHAPINIRPFRASMNRCGIRYAVSSSNGSNRKQINGKSRVCPSRSPS